MLDLTCLNICSAPANATCFVLVLEYNRPQRSENVKEIHLKYFHFAFSFKIISYWGRLKWLGHSLGYANHTGF